MHRSVALVAGYLMLTQQAADWGQAFAFVRRLRPCADQEYKGLIEAAVGHISAGAPCRGIRLGC